jgi:hypothetical protein
LIALAINLASEYNKVILKKVTQSALEICDGEYKDLAFNLKVGD